jgi:hypothetical protein
VDAFLLALERFHTHLNTDTGFVVVAKPSGGKTAENKFLAECVEHKMNGTNYVEFKKLAQNPVTMPSLHSRVLQAADIVVSVSTAMCAGHTSFAQRHFDAITRSLFIRDWRGLMGNAGLKLHPSILYCNVYYWILKEEFRAEGSVGIPIPEGGKPYFSDPIKY